jgi:hypothetical protein
MGEGGNRFYSIQLVSTNEQSPNKQTENLLDGVESLQGMMILR